MIKIFLPNVNNKFYNGIKYLMDPRIHIYCGNTIDIYKTHTKVAPDIYIFDASYITSEILQFINEYSEVSPTKIYMHHSYSNINKDAIKYIKKVKHIIPHSLLTEYKIYNNIIDMPKYMINEKIFVKNNLDRLDRVVFFLDNQNNIPNEIKLHLYPDVKNSKILLFNNKNIKHDQNIGTLSEHNKCTVLNSFKYFMSDESNDYKAEAYVCGAKLVDSNLREIPFDIKENEIITFKEFIKDIL